MNILYAFNPRTASLVVAKYVSLRYDNEIKAQYEAKRIADEFAGAILDVMTQQTDKASEADLQTLASAAQTQGDDAGRIEALKSEWDQFHAALSATVKVQLSMTIANSSFRELILLPPT